MIPLLVMNGLFSFVQPFLCEKLKIHDSCGVNNLHGMPGAWGVDHVDHDDHELVDHEDHERTC